MLQLVYHRGDTLDVMKIPTFLLERAAAGVSRSRSINAYWFLQLTLQKCALAQHVSWAGTRLYSYLSPLDMPSCLIGRRIETLPFFCKSKRSPSLPPVPKPL